MKPEDVWVRGETVADLIAALKGLRFGNRGADGMVSVGGTIGDPAVRALMRIEAELVLDDADVLLGSPLERTYGQRRADAFAQLFREIASAMSLP